MNNARIEQEADLALCQVAIQCPDAIVKTETSEEQLNQIRTGMGEDMTKLLQESKTQAICFTAEEGVKEAAPVTLSFGYQDTDRKGNRIDLYLKENSEMTVVMDYHSSEGTGTAAIQTKIHAEKNAKLKLIQIEDRALFHSLIGTEAFKIMLSQKISRRLFHGRDIQFTPQSVYVFSLKYTLPIRCFHVIRIRFPYSGKTAVEPLRCLLRIYDPYILRQIPVHILHGRCCRRTELLLNMEIGRLPPGMDPCIGPSGAMDLHFLSGPFKKHCLQLSLDRIVCIPLFLPAVVSGAIVFQHQPDVLFHDRFPSGPARYHLIVSIFHSNWNTWNQIFRLPI